MTAARISSVHFVDILVDDSEIPPVLLNSSDMVIFIHAFFFSHPSPGFIVSAMIIIGLVPFRGRMGNNSVHKSVI